MYINMLEHMNRNEILIILGGWVEGGGTGINVFYYFLNFIELCVYIYIGDPLMGRDTHRVCDY